MHSCCSRRGGFVLWISPTNLKFLQFLLKLNDQTLLIFKFGLEMSQLHVFSSESERKKEEADALIKTKNCKFHSGGE